MKIGLVGDVHGNLHALEAVLDHARGEGIETIWNIGDFVGYGPFPDEVVRLLSERASVSIIGNYDQKVLAVPKTRQELRAEKRPEKDLSCEWTYDQLSAPSRKFLAGLKNEARMEVQSQRVLLVHASVGSMEEHLTPDTEESRFQELAKLAGADIVIFGHSHIPFDKQVDGTWFINTGSVGGASDGDPRAAYAVLELDPGAEQPVTVQHYRVSYDVEAAAKAIREKGLPEAFAQMLLQGRDLKGVMPKEEDQDLREHGDGKVGDRLEPVIALAEQCHFEAGHTQQVTRLALSLFDALKGLHGLSDEERFYFECACLLHDIGWVKGRKGHHKTSLKLILEDKTLPFDPRERLIIGSVARYHRRALPKTKHKHFAALKAEDRSKVAVMAGLLRVADGLDRTHADVVRHVSCDVSANDIVLHCKASASAEEERDYALEKGKLLEKTLRRSLNIEFEPA